MALTAMDDGDNVDQFGEENEKEKAAIECAIERRLEWRKTLEIFGAPGCKTMGWWELHEKAWGGS